MPKKDSKDMMIMKKKMMIVHPSYPHGGSINYFIDYVKASTQYQQFDDVTDLVVKQVQYWQLAKGDVKSKFKLASIRYEDLVFLGINFEDQFYMDLTLLFQSTISCAIFEDIAMLLHWISDNFLMFHFLKGRCQLRYQDMQDISQDIGLPPVPKKLVPQPNF